MIQTPLRQEANVNLCEQVWVVLQEDYYESLNGDGEFHDFYAACFDRVAAEGAIPAKPGKWYRYHFVPLTVALKEDTFVFPGFKLGWNDSYRLDDVLKALELRLANGGHL